MESRHIRAALSGEILRRVPRWATTLDEIRALANEGMGRSVPHYCLDLVGQDGRLLRRDADLPGAGSFIDVVVVRRKVVCGECFERMRCFCRARDDEDCSCTAETEDVCGWCLHAGGFGDSW